MSAIRDEIRAILHEEIAALRSEVRASVETVRITSTADLNRFARDLITRASSQDFSQRVAAGEICFELANAAMSAAPTMATQPSGSEPMLDKTLITERDIVGLGQAQQSLRLMKHSRLTPLARDEVRRRGIRIERISS